MSEKTEKPTVPKREEKRIPPWIVNSTSLITTLSTNTIQDRADALKKFKEFIKTDFVDGVDFGLIPSTDKPTLFKAGYEKIEFYLGLSPQYRLINREFVPNQEIKQKVWNNETKRFDVVEAIRNFYSWEFACDLYSGDTKVAEGVGCANTEERKYVNLYNKKGETPDNLANTIMKIAKKRALGDAILNVGSISDMFTVDLEDSEALQKVKVDKTTKPNKITKDQIKTIFATLGALNLIDTDFHQILDEFGYKKIEDAKKRVQEVKPNEVNKVLARIQEYAKQRSK